MAAFLQERGPDELERLYRVINDIITDLDPAPGDALRDLAAIDDLRLFVSTTPDRLLTKARERSPLHKAVRGRVSSPFPRISRTSEQSQNAEPAEKTDTVVLNLFGQAASTPQYAIHDEDRLEWLHALLSDAASLPDWLASPLKHQPMLFIGCEIPDWLGRFLLRMSSQSRLSLERDQQFFFVGNSIVARTVAVEVLRNVLPQDAGPATGHGTDRVCVGIACALGEMNAARPRPAVPHPGYRRAGLALQVGLAADAPSIFISYMREDADAARRLCDAITSLGGDVWFDERQIAPGDAWEQEVLTPYSEDVFAFSFRSSPRTRRLRRRLRFPRVG